MDAQELAQMREVARKGPSLAGVTLLRELTESDVPLLAEPPFLPVELPKLVNLRHTHHKTARLVALGTPNVQISAMVGYSPERIGELLHDPAFADLVEHYRLQRDLIFADLDTRLADIGISAADELLRRFEENPLDFNKKELMDIIELSRPKGARGGAQPSGPPGSSSPLQVNLQFVGSSLPAGAAPVISVTSSDWETST